nr:transposase [Thiorhodococcus minor]
MRTTKALSAKVAALSEELAKATREGDTQGQRIDQLLEYIELLRRKRFGRSADRVPDTQLSLFDESELEALIGELEAQLPQALERQPKASEPTPRPPKRKSVRHPLPSPCPTSSASLICPRRRRGRWARIGASRL